LSGKSALSKPVRTESPLFASKRGRRAVTCAVKAKIGRSRLDPEGDLGLVLKQSDPQGFMLAEKFGPAAYRIELAECGAREVVAENLGGWCPAIGHRPGPVLAEPDAVPPPLTGKDQTITGGVSNVDCTQCDNRETGNR
jgi:hypothetical protein